MDRGGGGKSRTEVETTDPDRALENFRGYVAIGEVYQRSFCTRSLVDTHTLTRLAHQVLEYDPTTADIRSFWAECKACAASELNVRV